MFSLSDLSATKASDEAFEFELEDVNGVGRGIILKVLGSQSEKVTTEVARLVNARRRSDAARAMRSSKKNIEFEPIESDIEFGQRLAAIRLVGWTGIQEPWSPENALTLCRSNRDISAQIIEKSDDMSNFMKGSSKN